MTTSRSELRPIGWKASDEAFALWLAELAGDRRRRSRLLRYERPVIPSWVAAARGYTTRTTRYRALIRERPTPTERTA